MVKILINHIKKNLSKYIILSVIYIVGVIIGIIYLNNLSVENKEYIYEYINDGLQSTQNLNAIEVFKNSIIKNIVVVCIMWLISSTLIGIPIMLTYILYRGFIWGFLISCISYCLNFSKSLLVFSLRLLVPNIIYVFGIFALSINVIQHGYSLFVRKGEKSIKLELIRNAIFCLIVLGILFVESIFEGLVSII